MGFRIGTMFMGEVDSVGPQSVQTKFFVLGVPLVPLGSFFFTAPGRGIEIPINGRSVAAGYSRLVFGLGATLLVLRLFVMSSWHRDASDYAAAFGAAAMFVASLVFLGRLDKAEKRRRTVLLARTGLAADPAILPALLRSGIAADLRARLAEKELPLRAEDWAAAATAIAGAGASAGDGPYRLGGERFDSAAWGDAYAYARYAGVDDPTWRAALPSIWENVVA